MALWNFGHRLKSIGCRVWMTGAQFENPYGLQSISVEEARRKVKEVVGIYFEHTEGNPLGSFGL